MTTSPVDRAPGGSRTTQESPKEPTAPRRDFAALDRAAAERGGGLADEGVEIANRDDGATIVMVSRGLVGLRAMFLGSVSGAVVHHAKRPTVIVPPALSGG